MRFWLYTIRAMWRVSRGRWFVCRYHPDYHLWDRHGITHWRDVHPLSSPSLPPPRPA
jgi:hypothetical protein